ncbi:MAG: NADH-quinone oxidoreductase subunit H, partial [Eubacteriales bacterium]|nr:NADH-quinone oxidoreductase subunit H [Eubacteriales bacterium]
MGLRLVLVYLCLGPFIGGLLAGVDLKITARMQGRQGPPLLQPFYDVIKLLHKEALVVNTAETFLVIMFLLLMMTTGAIFFSGGDILLVIFALTLSSLFLLMAVYSTNSPYSNLGADRELLAMMAYEPMILFMAMGLYLFSGSFSVAEMVVSQLPAILWLPGVFCGVVVILSFKFRKSPFDISTSHHAHQELVSGLTTEFSGPTLAVVEITHWYENVMLLGFVYLFFSWKAWYSPIVAVAACLLVYFLEILVDNIAARVRWKWALSRVWILTATVGFLNIVLISLI